jgi:glycosyltransferase involved in cell wall biosynthesis
MAARYVAFAKRAPPDFIEVFNRPVMASLVARGLPGVPVALHYGNDPRGMAGSRTIGERRTLLAACAAIVCVSDYIRRCFLDGMDDPLAERVKVVHTGVEQPPTFPGDKTRKIVFVGRIVPDKGVLEFVEALARILPQHPGWSAEIIGAR